jgi:hypothetical protein
MANTPQTVEEAWQQNSFARAAILRSAVDNYQSIFTQTFDPTSQNVLNVTMRNVGLIKGLLVRVSGTLKNTTSGGGAAVATRSQIGAANLISQFVFNDYSNTVRVQTAGWHVHFINSAKQALVFGGAYAPNVPVNYGNNWNVQTAPGTIASDTTAAISFFYYVPLAYAKDDLRGAVYAGVVNATATLQITINTAPFVASGDATLAVYSGAAGGWNTGASCTVQVWQHYLDQLPMANTPAGPQPILPQMDMNTIYELKNTAQTGLTANQDFPIPYANFRTFLSTFVIFNNAGTLNVGSDVSYWSLRAANTTQIFQYPADVAALLARNTFYADLPRGCYYFDFRGRPINTQQFGNMELVLNPSSVSSGASLLIGFEDFAAVSQVQYASSLPAGG